MKYHIISDIPTSLYPQILDMIHLSFEEYKKKGLHFTCSDYQMADLERKVMRGNCFAALTDDGEVLGVTSVSIFPDGGAYENITAISPKAKGLGIGTALFEAYMSRLLSGGAKFIISDTAVEAKGSVCWHLKKCGYHKVGLESFPSTNYYSYIFRRDLEKLPFYVVWLEYPILYMVSSIKTLICKKRDGSFTVAGKYLVKLKNKLMLK